jgi:transposase
MTRYWIHSRAAVLMRQAGGVEPEPTRCLCCGSPRLRKLGEDITETLEVVQSPNLARASCSLGPL